MKRFRLISFIFCFSIINTGNAQTWEIQNSGVNNILNDVYFIDEFHGWAIGENSSIIATTDGGNNWQIQSSPVDSIDFEHVQFVNENVGYIVGRQHGVILSTNDGGNSWIETESGVDYSLLDLSFINADTGWVVGGDFFQSRMQGVILNTTNGGQTWEKQLETDTSYIYSGILFSAVKFIDENKGWAFGGGFLDNFSSTFSWRTIDGGTTWNIVGEVQALILELDIAPLDTIWCGGHNRMYKSINGGTDWTFINDSPDIYTNQDMELLNGHIGWYIGATSTGSKIRYTEDAALSWTNILTDQIPRLKSICALSTDLIWVVGDSGIVMKYSADSVSVVPDTENIPQIFELKQNYPNPFNSNTVIRFNLIQTNFVTLIIYDLTGRTVTILVSDELEKGTHNVIWDGKDSIQRNVASGIYFYQIKYGNSIKTKKLVLLR